MSYPINYPTPQGANIQIFKEGGTTSDWVKPQGASFVWFTLIGAGGAGGQAVLGTSDGFSGGSGAVTNCMVPAFLIPDILNISVGKGGTASGGGNGTAGTSSNIVYLQKDGTGYTLLTANGGGGGDNGVGTNVGAGGAATTSNYFSCMGIFQSIAGQDGAVTTTASGTTFLSGGSSGIVKVSANYGYVTSSSNTVGQSGMFQMQPIIVGLGSNSSTTTTANTKAGTGCGGGGGSSVSASFYGGNGGDGLVVIITW